MSEFPRLLHTVLDATDIRGLAEFYRRLLGLRYRAGDEHTDGSAKDLDWLVLNDAAGSPQLAFQRVERQERTTWPSQDVPMQLHLDFTVQDQDALEVQHRRALDLGAELLLDRADEPDEPLYVYADPAGHPFCIFVG